ncbi:hypothetical protein EC973_007967, partial [Apophysomyces ossiformis]
MNSDNYRYDYSGKDKYLLFFSQKSLKDWSYHEFEHHFQAFPVSPSKKKLIAAYKLRLAQIKDNKATPPYVKHKIDNLMEELGTDSSRAHSSTIYHINQGPSSVVNYGNNSTISTSSADTRPEQQSDSNAILGHKRAFDDIDDHQQSVQDRENDTLVRQTRSGPQQLIGQQEEGEESDK